jgi:nanoRNase/pAp phosphatase (c-di-AMP/oligoRNAs hydrolase)
MENNEKLQAIQRLKDAKNILVTVSDSPSIDQLAAALGFTLIHEQARQAGYDCF